jgi:hypothetical protein
MTVMPFIPVLVGLHTPVTWSPTDIDASVSLASANLVATSGAAGDRGTSSWLGRKAGTGGGKWAVEYLTGASWSGGDSGLGGMHKGDSRLSFGSQGTHGCAIYPSGNVWNNASQGAAGLGTIGANQKVLWLVDLAANLNWFSKDGVTFSFTGNPAAGTGGKTGGWATGDFVVPTVCMAVSGISVTIRCHVSDITLPLPSGFRPWANT